MFAVVDLEAPRPLPVNAPLFDHKRLALAYAASMRKGGESSVHPFALAYMQGRYLHGKTAWSVPDTFDIVFECAYRAGEWWIIREYPIT